ncbi:hypothetical protein G7Y89_g12642 [Cudoniella acicularis]|uniref:Uncharacterized protein n=1 Tax=Cudoniella acicularis TaxID=354080 RepID=A0A8H4RB14_9HELO|nr:hypothetical protein G7Y89_g12642 [Cudoniella acicularis]
MSSVGLNVGTWMPAEDDRLKEAVAKHGPRWVVVATEVGTRNGDQCAKRWNENLNPELDHSPWCLVEDRLLLHLVELYGHNWKFIANKFFEKRAPLSLKNRNSYLKRREKRQDQARTSQRRGHQSPSTSLSPTALYSTGLTAMPDVPINIAGTFPLSPDDSRDGSPHSSSPSITESELARLTSRASSSTYLSDVFSTLATTTGTKQSPQSDTQRDLLVATSGSMQDSQMSYIPDQVDWHHFMDNSAPFGHPVDNDASRALGTAFEGNSIPMLHPIDISTPHAQSSSTGTSTSSDDTVEYSLTCPRGKLKSLIQHLVDAAMPVTVAPGVSDEQQVVLNLRLRSCDSTNN